MDNKDKEIEELKEKIYQLEQNLGQCENGYSLELHTARMIIRDLEKEVAEYKQKIEKGVLVELPFVYGQDIYVVEKEFDYSIDSFTGEYIISTLKCSGMTNTHGKWKVVDNQRQQHPIENVFSTLDEAYNKLQELTGEQG